METEGKKSHCWDVNVLPFLCLHKLWIFHQHMSISSNCYPFSCHCDGCRSRGSEEKKVKCKFACEEKKNKIEFKRKIFINVDMQSIIQVWLSLAPFLDASEWDGKRLEMKFLYKSLSHVFRRSSIGCGKMKMELFSSFFGFLGIFMRARSYIM